MAFLDGGTLLFCCECSPGLHYDFLPCWKTTQTFSLSLEEVGPVGNVRLQDSNAVGLAAALRSAFLDES